MAGRATGWFHKRLVGDRALAAMRLPEAAKWLGYLLNNRQLGGAQRKVSRTWPDGTVITAELYGQQKRITIDVRGVGPGPKTVATVEGFIVRPSDATDQTGNTDLNHILLVPSGDGFKPMFYDLAHVPEAYEEGASLYGGAKALPAGLLHYGNVDWRSSDQSMMLTWLGPSARYGGYYLGTHGASTAVLCKGRILWDAEDHGVPPEGTEEPDLSDTLVRGACFRYQGPTLWLYLALRSRPSSPDDDDVIARYQVRSVALGKELRASPGAPPVIKEHLFPDLEVVRGSGVELHRSAALHFADGPHPWCFNTDGTEARRIYSTSGATYECIALEDEGGDWSISRTSIASLTQTTVDTRVRTSGPAGSYTVDSLEDDYADSGTRDHFWQVDQIANTSNESTLEFNPTSTISGGTTVNVERVKCAVDFWAGSWRYAEAYTPQDTYSSERTISPGYTTSETWHNVTGELWGLSQQTIAFTIEAEESRARVTSGLRTAFVDLVCAFGESYTGELTYGFDSSSYRSFVGGPSGGGQVADATQNCTLAAARTITSAQLEVHFLDLRFDTVYYSQMLESGSLTQSGELAEIYHGESTSYSGPLDETGSISDAMGTTLVASDTVKTWTTRLLIDATLVDEYVKTSSVAGSTGAGATIDFNDITLPISTVFLTPSSSVSSANLLADIGMQRGVASNSDWHAWLSFGSPPSSGGSGPSTGSYTLSPPLSSTIDGTYDFPHPDQISLGSWPLVKGRFLYSQENHPQRPAGEPLWRFDSSQAEHGLVPLLAAYPGAVRFHPVGYLPKTILVR